MINLFTDFDPSGKQGTQLIGRFSCWTRVVIQVQGPNTLRLANDKSQLDTPAPGGGGQLNGIQINASTGIFSTWWIGELWGIGSAPQTIADIQLLSSLPQQ